MQVMPDPEKVTLDENSYAVHRKDLLSAAEQASSPHGMDSMTVSEHREGCVKRIELPHFVHDLHSSPTLEEIRSILDSKCIVVIDGVKSELPFGALAVKLYQFIPDDDQLFLFR